MFITQSLHRNVQANPKGASSEFGDRSFTHAETMSLVSRIAGGLVALGAQSGTRIAVLAENSDRYHQLFYAIPWADCVLVPVNTRWSDSEVAYSLNEAESEILFVDDAHLARIDGVRELCPGGIRVVVHFGEEAVPGPHMDFEELISSSAPIEDAERGGDSLAMIIYTGGTTGFPKGVMLSHQGLMLSALGLASLGKFEPYGRALHVAPMFHLGDMASWLVQSALGATHVIAHRFDPIGTLRLIERAKITQVMLAPIMIQMMVDHPEAESVDVSSLTAIMYGTSPISESLLARSRAFFTNAQYTQAYGMTELSPTVTVLADQFHDDPIRRRSAGRVAPHALVKVVDQEGIEVPRGSMGEIVARCAAIMLGYWKQPQLTADAIRDGWMHTGDGGYMDEDGFLYIADRLKDMIISGGENVYSVEVENVIAKHSAVAQCAVIGIADAHWGERVHAIVQLHPDATLSLDELRSHCRTAIAGYKAPRSLELVDEFPTSGTGKILKRELRRRSESASEA